MKEKQKKYKALIIDVDGTLVKNFHTKPSKRVTLAVKKASKKLHVGLATSRPLFHAKPIMQHLNLSGPSIITNGAEIVDSTTHTILYEHQVTQDAMNKISEIISSEHLKALINDKGKDIEFDHGQKNTFDKPLDIWFPALTSETLKKILEKLSTIDSIYYWHGPSRFGGFDVVITHASATKQRGILEVSRLLGIKTHEIIGIGDGPNDFPLLMACGFKVAMGNAVSDLKAIADYVAPSVENDGVADVIEKFVL